MLLPVAPLAAAMFVCQAIPMDQYMKLLEAAANISDTAPATDPPTWFLQLDRLGQAWVANALQMHLCISTF
jgi:hypothetical protein